MPVVRRSGQEAHHTGWLRPNDGNGPMGRRTALRERGMGWHPAPGAASVAPDSAATPARLVGLVDK